NRDPEAHRDVISGSRSGCSNRPETHSIPPMDRSFDQVRLTYGITPPKVSYSEERRRHTAALQSARIAALPVDAVVVYDLQDESSRTDAKRPFPFLRAIDPLSYAYEYLGDVPQQKIVYRSVSAMTREELLAWLGRL